ncbi:MAG TPA: transposase [Deltaproteobacteria bacterium]|nr:transposase [Deltaproteobacteria bacterium]HOM28747.1 transposase [Deltaproteobacteria bacterium]
MEETFRGCRACGKWRPARGEDGLLRLMEYGVQMVLEEELTAYLKAGSQENTGQRAGYRNRYKPRVLMTRLGRMELMSSRGHFILSPDNKGK